MADTGRDHLGTVIWKHYRTEPNALLESSLRRYEILPSRNDSLQRDTGCTDNDSPEHHHTGPRIDSPETHTTSSTYKLGGRSFRSDPAIQKTPTGLEYDRRRTYESRGEQSIYLEPRWRRGLRQARKSDHRLSQTYLPCQPHSP